MTGQKATVLVIDDDREVIDLIEPTLKDAGYRVRVAKNADQGFTLLTSDIVDLILLDVQLPGLSGFKFIEILKQEPRTAALPVLMLTSRKSESDKVTGLHAGADDYLTKPFSMRELLARVQALLRRSRHEGRVDRLLEAGGIRIDLDAREAAVDGKRVDLRRTEFDLLVRLIQRSGQVLTYQVLSEALSEGSKIMTSGNLHSQVKNLRDKLGAAGERIETVHGIGYKFRR